MFQDQLLMEHWAVAIPIFGAIMTVYLFCQSTKRLLASHQSSNFLAVIIILLVWFWIGTRPCYLYADSGLYSQMFFLVLGGEWDTLKNNPKEWFWDTVQYFFIEQRSILGWYLCISGIYIGGMATSVYIWMRKHFLVAVTFIITSFGFFSYGTNGLRNGMALGMAMLALAVISTNIFRQKYISYVIGFIILYFASATHQSIFLITGAAILSLFYKDSKSYFIGWCICVLLSIIATGPMQSLFGSVIDDGRMQNYIDNTEELNRFSRTGFRWDFILFSMVPMVLGWYILFIKKIQNQTYIYLLNIYIIANAFWACVNSMPYSNRLAQLSWFLTPVLIAYPLLTLKVFKQQGTVLALFLLGYVGFGALMGY